jgi:hypothetical protein
MDLLGDWKSVFPELDAFESKASRKLAIRRAGRDMHATAWFAAICAVGMVLVVIFKEFAWGWLSALSPLSDVLFAWVAFLGMCTCHLLVIRKGVRRSLREQLNVAGRPTCMQCGYDLRGQIDRRCPECGQEFMLQEPGVTQTRPLPGHAGNEGGEVDS